MLVEKQPLLKKEVAVLICILALGAFLRFFSITEVPPGLFVDEAANGNNAVETLSTGQFKIFYPENNGREGLFIWLDALSIRVFGERPWALRIPSALFGTLTILGIYLLAKELFRNGESGIWDLENGSANSKFKILNSSRIALLSAFFLATSYWHINFSRIGFRAILVPFFAAFGIYWLLKGLRTGKISSTTLAGIFIGLGFYTYIAYRFIPFVLVIPLAWYLVVWWKKKNAHAPCAPCIIALFIFVTFITALPIGIYFLQHPGDFVSRSTEVSIFSAAHPATEFLKSNALTLQMFFWRGDCNPRHNFACAPELFWPVALFFAFGGVAMIAAFFKRKNIFLALFLFAWFFFMLLPATLTREGLPHALRSIGLIPPVFLLAGWGAATLWETATRYLAREQADENERAYWHQLGRIQKEITGLALLLLLFIAFQTWREYFIFFPESDDTYNAFSTDLLHIGEYIHTLPSDTQKIIIVNLSGDLIRGIPAPAQTPMFASGTFSEESRHAQQVTYVTLLADVHIPEHKNVAVLPLNPNDTALIQGIRAEFPALVPKTPGDFISFESRGK